MTPVLPPNGQLHDGLGDEDPEFLGAVQQLTERFRAGEFLDEDAIRREFPLYAEALCEALPGLRAVASLAARVRDDDPEALTGRTLAGYKLLRFIGQGGMGVVYEAWDQTLNRRVALKVLPPLIALDARGKERFEREAKTTASLDHKHIVPIYAVGVAGTTPFFAMKYIAGHSLAEVIRALRPSAPQPDDEDSEEASQPQALTTLVSHLCRDAFTADETVPSPPPPPRAPEGTGRSYADAVARLGLQAAQALQHAHDHDVIHRDIKPANLLLDYRGHLWVTDFGLARLRGYESTSSSAQRPGTLPYMSPEQLSPERLLIDHRTDLYSLGVTLYELLTRRRPHPAPAGRPGQVLRQILQDEPTPPRRLNPAVPRDLETVVLTAMAKETSRRYATARDLADDLRRFLNGESIQAQRPSLADRLGRWARRRRKELLAGGSSTALLLLLAIGVLAAQNRQLRRTEKAFRALSDGVSASAEELLQSMPPGAGPTHAFYTRMVASYEAALGQVRNPSDFVLRRRAALMHHHLARSFAEQSDHAIAVDHFTRAIDLLQSVQGEARRRPEGSWVRFDLFRCFMGRSLAQVNLQDGPRAVADGQEALRVVSDLARDEPENPDWLAASGNQHKDLAFLFPRGMLGAQEAEHHARQAIEVAERVTRMDPANPQHLLNLQWAHWALGGVYD